MTQFSLFGATVAEPVLDDLDGVLLAGGQWVRASDGTARLSVVVADAWRGAALAEEFELRGVAVTDGQAAVTAAEAGSAVRTGFHPALLAAARRWTRGASLAPPADLVLTARGLRLWAITTGRDTEAGYLLGTDQADDAIHRVAGAQLSALGIAAVSIAQRGGPGWRVTSAKRVRRLVELVGPAAAGAGSDWPHAY